MMRKNVIVSLSVLVILLLLAVSVFYIKVPYLVTNSGILQPVNEWRLEKTPDGKIINFVKNHLSNTVTTFSATEFVRGDLVNFSITEGLKTNTIIQKGDTIGYVSSIEEELLLLQTKRELEEQERLKDVYLTGEKPEIVAVAYQTMIQAEEELETQNKLINRLKVLHDDKIIADQEYELALNEFNIIKQEVAISKANYESLKSGSKKEDIAVVDAAILNLSSQIKQIEKRLKGFTIVAPISGKLIANSREMFLQELELEAMARVITVDSMILIMPVELELINYFKRGDVVSFTPPYADELITGTVYEIDSEIRDVSQRQMVFVISLIDNTEIRLRPNLKVSAEINGGEITLAEYIKRLVRTVVSN